MSELGALERYRPLVDDWPAFAAASRRPLPSCLWANPLRATGCELAAWLRDEGVEAREIPWLPGGYRLAADSSPGNLLAFVAGLCHAQEAVSLLPARLLDPQAGERVLDLCAAPGGKTAALCTALGAGGLVVANDRARDRLGPLRRTLARLGVTNVTVTHWDAASYPRAAGLYHRVLADVPCSCEGTSRKSPEVLERHADRSRLVSLQTAILAAAVRRCRPGGRVVYSTCTYAPEENEAVVDAVVRSRDDVRVLPWSSAAHLTGLRAADGLTAWEGRTYLPELAGALRVWPQDNDTGGFFVAVLERSPAAEVDEAPSEPPGERGEVWPESWRVEPPEPWLAPLREHFGFPAEQFTPFRLVARGRKRVWALPADAAPPPSPPPLALGLPLLRAAGGPPKLTTAAAMAFGSAATRNRVAVSARGATLYVSGQDVPAAEVGARLEARPGQVLIETRGQVLGVAVLREDGSLGSLYPKAWRVVRRRPA